MTVLTYGKRMKDRPLSPHLQVYKPQITSVLSITHRATGGFLAIGFFALAWFVVALAMGENAYQTFANYMFSTLGMGLLGVWSFCLFYHFANGIRHLFWDMGKGFEIENVNKSGWAVVIFALATTVGFWLCICSAI